MSEWKDKTLEAEWTYRYEERLAIMLESEGKDPGSKPTEEQKRIAREEADESCTF